MQMVVWLKPIAEVWRNRLTGLLYKHARCPRFAKFDGLQNTAYLSTFATATNVMYAFPGEMRQGLKVAWHPLMGTPRLRFTRF